MKIITHSVVVLRLSVCNTQSNYDIKKAEIGVTEQKSKIKF